jgi:N-acetylglucosamine-6-sulfatase
VLNIDLAPTLLDLAGVKSIVPMHGQSLVPLLRDAQAPGRSAFLAEYFVEKVGMRVPTWQAIRTPRWKYIRYVSEAKSFDELYDLQSDPGEERNVVADPAAAEQLGSLRRDLERLVADAR